ncbi:MAG: hypothetical protein M3O46_15905 [Myxococcota bacterium]|nr:hypothetical protein [Myxococcota bacterium]
MTHTPTAKKLAFWGSWGLAGPAHHTMSESPPHSATRIKRALADAGFEVFRSRGEEIVLAERPRENLIMDSGVRLRVGDAFEIRIVLRAQKADFPNEDESHLFERVRRLAAPVVSGGFAEVGTAVTPVMDPSDAMHTLDTFYEVTYAKDARELDDALRELKLALGFEKRAEAKPSAS